RRGSPRRDRRRWVRRDAPDRAGRHRRPAGAERDLQAGSADAVSVERRGRPVESAGHRAGGRGGGAAGPVFLLCPLRRPVPLAQDPAQACWAGIPPTLGKQYHPAKLVLFRDAINSACGFAQAATGPFYCPLDQRVYIDLGFYQELKDRFGAPGDFAQAYVLAHELGHHVQYLLATDAEMRRAQQARPDQANALSVRLELQADCYAGVWGHST